MKGAGRGMLQLENYQSFPIHLPPAPNATSPMTGLFFWVTRFEMNYHAFVFHRIIWSLSLPGHTAIEHTTASSVLFPTASLI